MKAVKTLLLVVIFWLITSLTSYAQCAMCRITLENNVSNGSETVLAAQLNFGILYLFASPYLLIATIGFFWYINSRKSNKTG